MFAEILLIMTETSEKLQKSNKHALNNFKLTIPHTALPTVLEIPITESKRALDLLSIPLLLAYLGKYINTTKVLIKLK